MKNKKRSLILSNSRYLLQLIYQFSPVLYIITIIAAVVEFLVSFLNLFYTKKMVDYIVGDMNFKSVLLLIGIWGFIYIFLRGIIITLDNYFRPVYSKVLVKGIETYLYDKAATVDLACYDNPDFYNEYIWATNNTSDMVISASDSISAFLGYALQISGVLSIVIIIDPSLFLVTIVSVILSLIIESKLEKLKLEYRKTCVTDEKKKRYVEKIFYLKDSAKDLRLTKIRSKLLLMYEEAYKGLISIIRLYASKITVISFLSTFGLRYVINTFFIYGFFAYKLIVLRNIELSEFVVINSAMVSLYLSLTRWSSQMNNLYKNALYVESLKKFIHYESKIITKESSEHISLEENFTIEFSQVSFTYPGEQNKCLDNISFVIASDKSLAIVGYNGAGKTTLIKLLLRLYDVDEGEILLNGRNIREYEIVEYRKLFSVVFQDFQLYALSLGENIMMDFVKEGDTDTILGVVDFADLTDWYKKIDYDYEKQITKEFDNKGINLSGGEEQKIAIARGVATRSKILILDEPSSALDPISEYNINKHILDNSKNHTTIMISHRLTSTALADEIIMFEQGRIIEHGTHKELMKVDKQYAYMYKLQAKPYRNTGMVSFHDV